MQFVVSPLCGREKNLQKFRLFRQSLSAYQPDWHICAICEFHSNRVCNLCSQAVLSRRAHCIICNFINGLDCFSMTKSWRCLARTRRSNSANVVPPIQGRLRFATLRGKHLSAASCKFLADLRQPRACPADCRSLLLHKHGKTCNCLHHHCN